MAREEVKGFHATIIRCSEDPTREGVTDARLARVTTDAGGIVLRLFEDADEREWHSLYIDAPLAEAIARVVAERRGENWETEKESDARRFLATAPTIRALV